LTGTLSATDESGVRAHLRECATCRAEAGELEDLWVALGRVQPMAPDAQAMRTRFAAILKQEQGFRPRVSKPFWQAAAAIVCFLAGMFAARGGLPADPGAGDLAVLRSELRQLRQMLTLSLLRQEWATERLQGVVAGGQLEDPGSEVIRALLDTLMHDPNVNVRLAAVDALARFADQQDVREGAVEALAAAESPLVQVALIDLMVGIAERQSIDTLRRLAADPAADAAVRARAVWGIEQLEARS
jgi:hypothetical protein